MRRALAGALVALVWCAAPAHGARTDRAARARAAPATERADPEGRARPEPGGRARPDPEGRSRPEPEGREPRAPLEPPARVDPVARARAREALTGQRASATLRRARLQGLVAYRLARRRAADALGAPAQRAETARALEGALLLLRRSAIEAVALARELGHARAERLALERGGAAPEGMKTTTTGGGAPPPAAVAPPGTPEALGQLTPDPADGTTVAMGGGAALDPTVAAPFTLLWPVRGTLVGMPGLRRDPASGTTSVSEGLELLGRMNDPVRAVAAGQVRLVVALPQGGHAVVTQHAPEQISILTGLREVHVSPGATVAAGAPIGLLGRDLDGAPVLTFELWQSGVPIDPRSWLPEHPPRK